MDDEKEQSLCVVFEVISVSGQLIGFIELRWSDVLAADSVA